MARALNVVGLMNVQFAIQNGARLRARGESARVAHRALRVQGHRPAAGQDRRALHGRADRWPRRASPARSCRRTSRSRKRCSRSSSSPASDTILGPEMKSTGEVMGVGRDLRRGVRQVAARRRREAADARARRSSACANATSRGAVEIARTLVELGFELVATRGTAAALGRGGRAGDAGEQGRRRPAAHRRHDQERRDRADRQHGRGEALGDPGLATRSAARRCSRPGADLHDARRRARGRDRHARHARARSRTRCRRCTSGCRICTSEDRTHERRFR